MPDYSHFRQTVTDSPPPARRRRCWKRRASTWKDAAVAAAAAAVMMLVLWQPQLAAAQADCDPAGLKLSVRHYTYNLTALPDWATEAGVDVADYTKYAASPNLPVTPQFSISLEDVEYNANIAMLYEGYIQVDVPATVGGTTMFFEVQSSDGARLYVDDTMLLEHDGTHPFSSSNTGYDSFPTTKRYKFRLEYFKGNNATAGTGGGLNVTWSLPRQDQYTIPASAFFQMPDTSACSSPPPAPVSNTLPPPPQQLPQSPGTGEGRGNETSPTVKPTPAATKKPSKRPTRNPTRTTQKPTKRPTKKPTKRPTKKSSKRLTKKPTRKPTKKRPKEKKPTRKPTKKKPSKRRPTRKLTKKKPTRSARQSG